MAQLLAPSQQGPAGSGNPILTNLGIATVGARTLKLDVHDVFALSGNGAWVGRLYQGATPLALTTQIGAQIGPIAVPDQILTFDLSTYTPGLYLTSFVSSSTVGNLQSLIAAYDDVGGYGSMYGNAGGFWHDPMLDDILAAVTKTITNTP